MASGVGVERLSPVHSPRIAKIEVTRRGIVRRAKLYYLRGLTGKAARCFNARLTRQSNRVSSCGDCAKRRASSGLNKARSYSCAMARVPTKQIKSVILKNHRQAVVA